MVSVREQVAGSRNLVVVEVIAEEDNLRIHLEGCVTLVLSINRKSGKVLRILVLLHAITLWSLAIIGQRLPVALPLRGTIALGRWRPVVWLLGRIAAMLLATLVLLAWKERHDSNKSRKSLQAGKAWNVVTPEDCLQIQTLDDTQGRGGVLSRTKTGERRVRRQFTTL